MKVRIVRHGSYYYNKGESLCCPECEERQLTTKEIFTILGTHDAEYTLECDSCSCQFIVGKYS